MLKPARNSVRQSDIDDFQRQYDKLQGFIDTINDKKEQVSTKYFLAYLEELLECTNKLVTNPIKEEIDKLKSMLDAKGTNEEFFEQFNYLTELVKSEVDEETYIPINETFSDIYDKQATVKGISFLCEELDKRTGGLYAGKIATIVGGPGSMKTTYATNICYEAVKQGKNVCFLSLEETPLDIYSKLLSRVSVDLKKDLSTQNITQHKLSPEETKTLKEEVHPYLENLSGTFYLLGENDLGDFSQNLIEDKLRTIDEMIKIKSKEKQDDPNHGIDIIVVDHLQMFKYVTSKVKDEFQLMNMYVSFFRRQAKKFLGQDREVAIILLSQCNREGIKYAKIHDGEYLMQHVAEASEIERASSYIISIYTDAMSQTSKIVKIGAIKLRGAALPVSVINIYAKGEYYHLGDTPPLREKEYSMTDLGFDDTPTTQSTALATLTDLDLLCGF